MKYSAKKAAEAVGKSVPTITRAIKSGKLSAEKNKKGGYMIDPSELFRVYPPEAGEGSNNTGNATPTILPFETPKEGNKSENVTPELRSEINLLREQIQRIDEMNTRERERLESQIDDLRHDRDKWQNLAEKQADTMKLLTYQQETDRKAAQAAAEKAAEADKKTSRGLFGLLKKKA